MLHIEEERAQVYTAHKKNTTPSVRLTFYEQFSIDPSAKKKK